ncbi:MAG: phage tail protein [Solirubrobacteraceae bacterium]
MSSPYVGEIRMFAGDFAPAGWAFCDGQVLPISQNTALFSLLGTTYGGDGQSTFALPDLRGRLPVHQGTGSSGTTYELGATGGAEQVTLTESQIPSHAHAPTATTAPGTQQAPGGAILAGSPAVALYSSNAPAATFDAGAVANAGDSQPHANLQPYLCVNFIISLSGVFPTQS